MKLFGLMLLTALSAQAGKVKVFILAGQSNMQGHAKVTTFDYLADDPRSAPLLKQMRDDQGKPRVHDGVRIAYLTGQRGENVVKKGKLTAGYGAPTDKPEDAKIGPELTFGIAMDKAFDEPVLLIKTAWGGKSLYHDFRSPSSGVYQRSEQDIERKRFTEEMNGHYYRLMIDFIHQNLKGLNEDYEIAGFVWFQGWNDMVNRGVYPPQKDGNQYANYGKWMADFIRDVRKDLKAPRIPFVIGVMGVGGKDNEKQTAFREAMAMPTRLKEFAGNVAAVPTAEFWADELGAIADKRGQINNLSYRLRKQSKNGPNADGKMTKEDQRRFLQKYEKEIISAKEAALWQRGASNAGYHYLGCAKTFALMGDAFARAILKMRN